MTNKSAVYVPVGLTAPSVLWARQCPRCSESGMSGQRCRCGVLPAGDGMAHRANHQLHQQKSLETWDRLTTSSSGEQGTSTMRRLASILVR